jgi:hypothetical protein
MADGGDGYDMLAADQMPTYFGGLDEVLTAYIQSGAELPAEADGRIKTVE